MRTYQVEYMTRPDEVEHIKSFGTDLEAAKKFARQMSDKHDGSSALVAIDRRKSDDAIMTVGHIDYMFGIQDETTGVFSIQP